ncbi:Nif3-like dinuclear metal center hexameric protein [Bacillus sp. DJP31]|uniref:Nif3-like dinuclear metal center hexameric protein n=1 Tax=Bacillus sp. DJP31 TaxID=3409789 RepID=UPI003BB502B9
MTKVPNGFEIIEIFERFSPMSLAFEDDKFGLQIGTLNKSIHNVMVTLDVLEEVVDEAIKKNVNLLLSHHPPIFRPLKHIRTDTVTGRIIEKCLKHDITVYSAHSNLDITEGGVNDLLAEALELKEVTLLTTTQTAKLKKLVVFVPETHAEKVKNALASAGAGHIGNYSHCSFSSRGIGNFKPEDGANPFIGVTGKLEHVEEVRVETIFPSSLQRKVIRDMIQAHPYEEIAYDIYPLDNKGKEHGLGRVGFLKEEMTLEQFSQFVKKTLDVDGVRIVGDLTKKIKKVAVLGGDGNKYIPHAHFAGADVFVSGDIYYHLAHEAMALGLSIVDPGHHMEKVMMNGVASLLKKGAVVKKFNVNVFTAQTNTNPFTFR